MLLGAATLEAELVAASKGWCSSRAALALRDVADLLEGDIVDEEPVDTCGSKDSVSVSVAEPTESSLALPDSMSSAVWFWYEGIL